MDPTPPWRAVAEQGRLAVLLVRHGQTAFNAQRRFLGTTDPPLNEVGRAQAHALSTALGNCVDRVITSPLARARETALALHPAPEVRAELRELDQGALEGLTAPEAFRRFPEFFAEWSRDPGAVAIPGGEAMSACRERMLALLDELARDESPGRLLSLVGHKMAIAAALCGLTGEPLRNWRDHRLRNCGIAILGFDGKSWKIEGFDVPMGNMGITGGSNLPGV